MDAFGLEFQPQSDTWEATFLGCMMDDLRGSVGLIVVPDSERGYRIAALRERRDGESYGGALLPSGLLERVLTAEGPLLEPLLSIEAPLAGPYFAKTVLARGVAAPMPAVGELRGAVYIGFPMAREVDSAQICGKAEAYAHLAAMCMSGDYRSLNDVLCYSNRDALTGCLRYRVLLTAVDAEIKRSKRRGHDLSILFIDLDHFKEVNDSIGHLEGNRILAEVGRALRAKARAYDIVGRFGGDEFVVALPETAEDMAFKSAERFSAELHNALTAIDAKHSVEVSIGVATLQDETTAEELLRTADVGLTKAKQQGGAQVSRVT